MVFFLLSLFYKWEEKGLFFLFPFSFRFASYSSSFLPFTDRRRTGKETRFA